MIRRSALLLTATFLALTAALAMTGTAQAYPGNSGKYGTSFVDGAGDRTDDFGDHFNELGNSLCNGCADSQGTDLVMMWQAILYAEGFIGESGIDGYFGPNTATATKKWQIRHNLSVDGKVGKNTWNAADNRLSLCYGWSNVCYYAKSGDGYVKFTRGSHYVEKGAGAYSLDLVWDRTRSNAVGFDSSQSTPRIHFFKRTLTRI